MGSTVASYFGGGAAFANGAWTAPVYVTQGGSHGNVGDAFAAVDGALSTLDTRATDLEAAPGGGGTGPPAPPRPQAPADRKRAVEAQRVFSRVHRGGRRNTEKKN